MNENKNLNEKSTIHELEIQAKNTKQLVDRINKAYLGLTTDELIKLALADPEESDKPTPEKIGAK